MTKIAGGGSLLLAPAAGMFRVALALRTLFYAVRPQASVHLPVPTIGVGNLSVGGTGKTTMVSCLVEMLEVRGLRVGVLARGYGRPARSGPVVVVSQGNGPVVGWEEAGDEPFLLARRHPGAVVVVGARRVEAGRRAVEELGAQVLVLDDAFQHWRVRCDLEILMVDRSDPPWQDHLLPRGRLREPADAARRAHLIVEVGGDSVRPDVPARSAGSSDGDREGWAKSGSSGSRVVRATYRLRKLHMILSDDAAPPGALAGRPVFLFSGIGNPHAFAATAASLGTQVVGHRILRDHHRYGPSELQTLSALARGHGAEALLTTEKDAVRVSDMWVEMSRSDRGANLLPLWVSEVDLALPDGESVLRELLTDLLADAAGDTMPGEGGGIHLARG